MRLIMALILCLFLASPLLAEEKPVPNVPEAPKASYDLPRDQVEAYGRMEAEARALRAETTLALREIEEKRAEILEKWKAMVGGDLKGWQLDLAKGQLRKEGTK